jgi:hypothetical protein
VEEEINKKKTQKEKAKKAQKEPPKSDEPPPDLEGFEAEIEAMTPNTSDESIMATCIAFLRTDPSPTRLGEKTDKIKKKLQTNAAGVKKLLRAAKLKVDEERGVEIKNRDEQGRRIFRYETAGFNFHDATKICIQTLINENRRIIPTLENLSLKEKDRRTEYYPIWSQMNGTPVKLTKDEKTDRYYLKEYTTIQLWAHLSGRIVFCRKSESGGDAPMTQVDEKVAQFVYNQFYDDFPESPEIIYTPLFAPDGKLISTPGYYGGEDYPGLNLILADNALDVGTINTNPDADDA